MRNNKLCCCNCFVFIRGRCTGTMSSVN